MNYQNAVRILNELPAGALVLDVGGGASPFPRADFVADAIPFEERATLKSLNLGCESRYSKKTWVQLDLCEHKTWPFKDKQFDFATCSHLLEDVRDPIWICSELCRVAKAGYIETPSRILEQTLGIEHPKYAGYYHHRWLISAAGNRIEFRHKPHLLHATRDAIVTSVGIRRELNPDLSIFAFEWRESFEFAEVHEFVEAKVVDELCGFARSARQTPNLTVPASRSPIEQLKRAIFFRRLASGRR